MNIMLKTNKKLKILFLGVIVISVLAITFFVVRNLLQEREIKNNSEDITLSEIQKQYEKINEKLFIVSGELVCLPLKNDNTPHNDLCVFGIKDSNNDYYRLQAPSDDKNNVVNKIRKGQKIEISGELMNEESDIYKTSGTIKVIGVKYLFSAICNPLF